MRDDFNLGLQIRTSVEDSVIRAMLAVANADGDLKDAAKAYGDYADLKAYCDRLKETTQNEREALNKVVQERQELRDRVEELEEENRVLKSDLGGYATRLEEANHRLQKGAGGNIEEYKKALDKALCNRRELESKIEELESVNEEYRVDSVQMSHKIRNLIETTKQTGTEPAPRYIIRSMYGAFWKGNVIPVEEMGHAGAYEMFGGDNNCQEFGTVDEARQAISRNGLFGCDVVEKCLHCNYGYTNLPYRRSSHA